jgi:hypothetical protein
MLYYSTSTPTLPKVMTGSLHFSSNNESHRGLLDRIGATGSTVCAVHCAALPLVLILAPAVGAWFGSATFEVGFIAFASVLGLASLLIGYRRHRSARALSFLSPGLGLLWTAVLVDQLHQSPIAHAIAMATGGTLLATAHVINLRLSRRHGHGCHTAC